jgi:hypothetical protein
MKIAQLQCLSALALFALLLSNAAYSQIKYTDIDPDTTIICPTNWDMVEFFIDLDRDNQDDFRFVHFAPVGDDHNRAVELYVIHGGGDLALLCNQQKQPLALEHGDLISLLSPKGSWISAFSGQMVGCAFLNRNDRLNEPWEDVSDRYLGVAKHMDGAWHYGWIRLDVPLDASWFTVKDFAINMNPGEGLLAGSGSPTSIDPIHPRDLDVDVYGIGKSIVIEFNTVSAATRHFSLYDLIGSKLSEGQLVGLRTTIPMASYPAGNYIAIIREGAELKSFRVNIW